MTGVPWNYDLEVAAQDFHDGARRHEWQDCIDFGLVSEET